MEIDMESTLTSKGQATIPKDVRDYLKLKPGDQVKFFKHPNGTVVLLPKLPASAMRGMIKRKGRAVTVEEMNEAVTAGATEKVRRSSRQ